MSITRDPLRRQRGYQDILLPAVEQFASLSLLESRQSGHSDTKALEIFTRRQLQHDRIAAAHRYHPGLFFATAVVGFNLMIDLIYPYLDPRVRYE